MVESATQRPCSSITDPSRLWRIRRFLAACSLSAVARELLAEWRFVSRTDPPSWLLILPILVAVLFETAFICLTGSPWLGPWQLDVLHTWLDRHQLVVFLGVLVGWAAVMWATFEVGCLIANGMLLVGQAFCFPILLSIRWAHRLVGCWRVLQSTLGSLGRWLAPDDAIDAWALMMPRISTAEALAWNRLSPAQAISRWLELGSDWLKFLPFQAWPELIMPDLSPTAMAILFRRSLLYGGRVSEGVTAAIIRQGWFGHPQRRQLLVRELAALPVEKLAAVLGMICESSRSRRRHTMCAILDQAQKCGDVEVVRHFQGAIALMSAEASGVAGECR